MERIDRFLISTQKLEPTQNFKNLLKIGLAHIFVATKLIYDIGNKS